MKKIVNFLFVVILLYAQPYTILVSFDGFRWDYLKRNITPNIDKMIENGVHAVSLKPVYPSITFPNHISIISGVYPQNHNIISNFFKDIKNNKEYKITDTFEVRNPYWYNCEPFWETAEKNGIKTSAYFWPFSDNSIPFKRPSIYKKYDHFFPYTQRVDSILSWITLPYNQRPKFFTLYFDATDTYGHKFGTDSKEIDSIIVVLDNLVGSLINGLKKTNLLDSTNIVLVSDHGMYNIKGVINLYEHLKTFKYEKVTSGTIFSIEAKKQKDVYKKLKENENNYKVYLKKDIPNYLNIKKAKFLGNILVVPEPGYIVTDNPKTEYEAKLKASHGWDNNFIHMHGIFVATGPSFKKNYKIGTLSNIDIYPLLCKIYNINYNHKIDGKIENIDFILKEE
ncbi:MAG TPA: alkaline phosphatase family protein [Ignavibacteriales bacterium]|nr:alkaline phosphatase family protein [Ignavibacteriales bacterium]HOL81838.1 alkaline phosphatase family protein [Ignavibacteriales bacterium]HOM65061.1 alkaline phosphatase family protein [Ignavibacteriales bacterium]HPD67207.1 alkaline phosphatase family protein [Ignavibacteriales bacterium]HPP34025.1 alkaline phosphatase family protein [Ignavibacteriales bacterium]